MIRHRTRFVAVGSVVVLLVIAAVIAIERPAKRTEAAAVREQIAVARAGAGLDLIAPDGRRITVLTRHRGWEDTDPAWSPDGKRIVFTRTKNVYRSLQVYVMRADGSGVHRITSGRYDLRPAWSPDGRWIAYQSETGIRIVRPDGTGGRHVPTPDRFASFPTWTSDGHIAYAWHSEAKQDWPARCRRAGARCGWVWTSEIDGSHRDQLVRGRDAHWSPAGTTVVFTPPDGGVAKVAAEGGRSRLLGRGFQAEWSRDGRRIVYTRAGAVPSEDGTWLMNRDGSGAHPIRPHASMPAWRPR